MKKTIIIISVIILFLILTPIVASTLLFMFSDLKYPEILVDKQDYRLRQSNDTTYCKDSYIHVGEDGLWDLYLCGSNQERGAKQGALTEELMKYQEDVFMKQIQDIIPSESYLWFLHKMIIIFNRNIGDHITLEYRNEIGAMSEFCTSEYNAIGTPYERQLNYHGAHDIGHTMQQYMLVGCSSFATWGENVEGGGMIVGRNFDFYVGDDFAKNRIVSFVSPDDGYRYTSISWAGMVGVLSGMNETGLTVTINAGKGSIPTSAATPISILTREILQYASTIDEAYEIASKRKTFVSESILVGSKKDGIAAIIEKTPEKLALFKESGAQIVCTNHFQAKEFEEDEYNVENIKYSDSKYRYSRLEELLEEKGEMNVEKTAAILRDNKGQGGSDIGVGNEMTLNQSIAHHSVVFKPSDSLMWVSTPPWQSGKYVCYDLRGFFEDSSYPEKVDSMAIAEDKRFMEEDYGRILAYREGLKFIKKAIGGDEELREEYVREFLKINPEHYYSWRIVGDYYYRIKDMEKARYYYGIALDKSIPYLGEREELEELISETI